MAIGYHSEALLQVPHRVAQVKLKMTGEILNLVAEVREPALQRDALVA
jgi:hypothetical protein